MLLSSRDGRVTDARCYSDAMDEAAIGRIAPQLVGQPVEPQALAAALNRLEGELFQDMAQWLGTVVL